MRVVFMGTPSYATVIFQALLETQGIDVVLLVTQEDKPVGRKQVLTPPHIKSWLLEQAYSLDIYQPKTLKTEEAYAKIASYQPDFIVVAAYGQILPASILGIAPCINLHASLLPKYRGASPIQSTLLDNEKYAGVTSMLMEQGLDTGAMLGFTYYPIQPSDNAAVLFDTLAHLAALLTKETLFNFSSILPIPQCHANASLCKKIKKDDGLICFDESAKNIYTKYKAFSPWPGIFISSGLKLLDIELVNTKPSAQSGCIVAIHASSIEVACHEGHLLIRSVQPMSKNAMSSVDYIRGKRFGIGDLLV